MQRGSRHTLPDLRLSWQVRRAREEAERNPPPPHDPMRFRAVPVGESDSEDDSDLPPSCRISRKGRRQQQQQEAAAAAAKRPEEPEAADADTPLPVAGVTVGSETDDLPQTPDTLPASQPDSPPRTALPTPGITSHPLDLSFVSQEDGEGPTPQPEEEQEEEETVSGSAGLLGELHRELLARDRQQREEARVRALEQAALRTERRLRQAQGEAEEAAAAEGGEEAPSARYPLTSPMVWGTQRYRDLWELAKQVESTLDERQRLEEEEEQEEEDGAGGADVDPFERYSLSAQGGVVIGQSAFHRDRQMVEEEEDAAPAAMEEKEVVEADTARPITASDIDLDGLD